MKYKLKCIFCGTTVFSDVLDTTILCQKCKKRILGRVKQDLPKREIWVMQKGNTQAKACEGYDIKAGDAVWMCSTEYGGCGGIFNANPENNILCRNCKKIYDDSEESERYDYGEGF